MQQMQLAALAVILVMTANSIQDIRKREIILIPTAVAAAAGIILRFSGILEVRTSFISFMPALFLFCISLFTGRAGLGDVLILLFMGIWLDAYTVIFAFSFSLAAAAGFSAVYVFILKDFKNREIPLVPFLTAGIIVSICTQF